MRLCSRQDDFGQSIHTNNWLRLGALGRVRDGLAGRQSSGDDDDDVGNGHSARMTSSRPPKSTAIAQRWAMRPLGWAPLNRSRQWTLICLPVARPSSFIAGELLSPVSSAAAQKFTVRPKWLRQRASLWGVPHSPTQLGPHQRQDRKQSCSRVRSFARQSPASGLGVGGGGSASS